jgi:sugar lactone lactonase YvrE
MARKLLAGVLAAALAGCHLPTTRVTTPSKPHPSTPAAVASSGTPVVAALAGATHLTGTARLLSDHGSGVISNNSGNLISNNGGAIIGNNGGSLTGKTKRRLLALEEALLADARVEVFDATGKPLLDDKGQPVGGTTNRQGAFAFDAVLPARNLVLRIKLWNGGELSAMLPRGVNTSALDTASTLGAAYVLGSFVKGDQAVYDKLPAAEADRLRQDLVSASGAIDKPPSYAPADMVALTGHLRDTAPAVAKTLDEIKVLLLGQARLGAGKPALEVPLTRPDALIRLPDGSLLISEEGLGRLRHMAPDGSLTTWFDALQGERSKASYFGLVDMTLDPDGSLYFVQELARHVRKMKPDGTIDDILPPGLAGFDPFSLLLEADGTLLVGENFVPDTMPRLLALAKDGTSKLLPVGPEADWKGRGISSLVRTADGTLWALLRHPSNPDSLYLQAPGSPDWKLVTKDVAVDRCGALLADPAGGVLLSEDNGGRIKHVAPDGTSTVIAGAGGPPGTAALVRPAGMWREADGSLLVADSGNGVIYTLRDNTLKAIAGATTRSGELALNQPNGGAIDASGRLVLTEGGSHSLRAWDGQSLTTLGGGTQGFAGDGGPLADARFSDPTGLAVDGAFTWILDSLNGRIRRVDASGTITTVVGSGTAVHFLGADPVAPADYQVPKGAALIIGPEHRPIWDTPRLNQIHRLRADGQVELLAGGTKAGDGGDGGPARAALFNNCLGLALGPDGALYVADAGNMRIRKITGLGAGQEPQIESFMGKPTLETFAALAAAPPAAGDRRSLPLLAPLDLAFDAAGNLYVAELGTLYMPMISSAIPGLDQLPPIAPRIRKIAPDGAVTTVAGPGGKVLADPTADDALVLPTGLLFDRQGRLVILDSGANAVRFVPASAL